MQIRPASPDDCRAIADLHVASWQIAYADILDPSFLAGLSIDRREASWRQVLAAGGSQLLLGFADSTLVGFASFGPSRDQDAPLGRGELWALYVHPLWWSTGAGRELWQAALPKLQSQGFSSVSLWVLEKNVRAIAFYSTAGFELESGSAKDFELGGSKVREVRMVYASPVPG